MSTVRVCTEGDAAELFEIINDAAQAYEGIIPADQWRRDLGDPVLREERLPPARV
jgi:hypothetical protein